MRVFKKYYLFFVLAGVMTQLFSVNLCASEEGSFLYVAGENRDPFKPLITKDGKISFGYGDVKSIQDLKLEGIVFDPAGESVAIINDSVLKVNGMIGTIKVVDIKYNEVVLLFQEKEHIMRLVKE